MVEKFTSEDVDGFILHWERKFPLTVRRICRFWDLVQKQDSGKLQARILYERNEATKDFHLGCDIALKDYEQRHVFDIAVMDRVRELRATNQINQFLGQTDGPSPTRA